MKKQKSVKIKLIDAEPPEHVKKMQEIITNTNIPEDEFCLLITGKKTESESESGFNMYSGYHIGEDVDIKQMAKAFFSDLMLLEMNTNIRDIVIPFLLAASDIIKQIKQKSNNKQIHETNVKQHLS